LFCDAAMIHTRYHSTDSASISMLQDDNFATNSDTPVIPNGAIARCARNDKMPEIELNWL
jgi:hypothetical protein